MTRPFQIPQLHGVSRNVHLFDGNGGYQNDPPQLTSALLCAMCDHFLGFEFPRTRWYLFALGNNNTVVERVARNSVYIRPGKYAVLGRYYPLDVWVTDERLIRRVLTPQPPSSQLRANQAHFRDSLRRRDGTCAISGHGGVPEEPWLGINAAHIYPVSQLDSWNWNGYSRWVIDTTDPSLIAPNRLFSPENGRLLDSSIHILFNYFKLAVSPEVRPGIFTISLSIMQANLPSSMDIADPRTRPARDRNRAVSDDLLRWHFHQAILTNMKGTDEDPWDLDYAGGDPMDIILAHEEAADIMAAELATRLGAYMEETVTAEAR
ncbi:HNH endonuclease signature motif containing protein [Aspergillus ibericus CBS 121593]|uniref:HNH nuclease domain-containing protein n=1 Tax=Aspergillus ibericus CBS 121593 TaxID=1448316 RepID=A0A395GKG2_9EURO|nr:hypothetical protein BO80DRAFT_367485 [Aspergillus ibericus CBS 121593]RAK95981.1 hypothetical protein BO80DRAFT_367485 [Aspergillus ibericus CBS 121593]